MTSGPPTEPAPVAATPEDHALAAELAGRAGVHLVALRARLASAGADAATLKAEGDRTAHDLLMVGLADRAAAGDGILSEEGADDRTRLAARRVWIVDPLDGTREFSEVPRTDWAVHVALAVDGVAVAGAVALPALDQVLTTDRPPTLAAPVDGAPRLAVSRSRPPAVATHVADRVGGTLVPMGSAGAKAMAVLRGEADIYVHAGGQYEWDNAAPAAVAAAAGAHVSRLDGSPLRYNAANPWLPDLVVCRPEWADAVLDALDGQVW